jgi:hypothetical protein
MRCITCLLNLGNTITFLALKVALKKYVDEPELLTRDELPFGPTIFTIGRTEERSGDLE